jgi:hypothetical protein
VSWCSIVGLEISDAGPREGAVLAKDDNAAVASNITLH